MKSSLKAILRAIADTVAGTMGCQVATNELLALRFFEARRYSDASMGLAMLFDGRRGAQRQLRTLGFKALEPFLMANLRETVVFQEFGEAPSEQAGLTKFGGPPDVPKGFQWPRVRLHADFSNYSPDFPRFGETAPLPFIGQFDLNRLGRHLGGCWPRRGIIWLFGLNVQPRFELAGTVSAGYRWLYAENSGDLAPLQGSEEQKEFEVFAETHLGGLTGYGLDSGMYLSRMRPCVQLMPAQNPVGEWTLSNTFNDLLRRGDSLRSVLSARAPDKQLFTEIKRWSDLSGPDEQFDDEDEEIIDDESLIRMGGFPGPGPGYLRPGKNMDRGEFDSQVFSVILDARQKSSPEIAVRLEALIERDRNALADGISYAVENELLLQLQPDPVILTAWTPREEVSAGRFDTARVWSTYLM